MLRNLLAIFSAVLFTGCAWTNSSLPITISPTVNQPLSGTPKGSLKIAPVKDERTVSDKAVVMQKVNGYGQRTRGAYVAQKPVAEIFRDALVAALQENKFPVSENGTMVLQATIEDVNFQVLEGFWTATVEPRFRVKFAVIEEQSNKVAWKDGFAGKVQRKTAWGTATFVGEIVSDAAEDAIRQLVEDPTFRAVFAGGQ